MKGKKRSHLENFQRVCAVCWNKCSRSARPVEITLINEFVIENYTSNSVFFPAGICPSCSRVFIWISSWEISKDINDFQWFQSRFLTRNTAEFWLLLSHLWNCKIAPTQTETRLMGPKCSNCFAIIYQDNVQLFRCHVPIRLCTFTPWVCKQSKAHWKPR